MNFRLPKLDQVIKLTKDNVNDVSNHIFVKNGVAVVKQPYIILCTNLREYIKRELKVDDTDDIEKMDEILEWFEGKYFTKEFWKELTSTKYVSLSENGLLIEESSYEKSLIYEYPMIDKDEINNQFDLIKTTLGRKSTITDRVCFNSNFITDLNKVFGSDLKVDDLLLDFGGKDQPMLFSGRLKDYIFGCVAVKYEESSELLAFDNVMDFVSNF